MNKADELLHLLPADISRRIKKLAGRTKSTPAEIIRSSLTVLERAQGMNVQRSKDFEQKVNDKALIEIEPNMELRSIYVELQERVGRRKLLKIAGGTKGLQSQSSDGGKARSQKLSAERRREIGKAAIKARWDKAKARTPESD